jgi:hypothetical protein
LTNLLRRKSWKRKFLALREATSFYHLWHDRHFVLFVLHTCTAPGGSPERVGLLIDSFGSENLAETDIGPLWAALDDLDPSLKFIRTTQRLQFDEYRSAVAYSRCFPVSFSLFFYFCFRFLISVGEEDFPRN